ncbi:MAG: YebC/PmpR family DNA-binding transcriptional regulator [Elusimicrobia bacterium]|nr:YebC/PmpR family DNA-binding transcriptional regulator [Elusimicrobiota bacterium]
MGGHSHWAGIKHKKAITDAKKGKVWTKIVREITIAARLSGGDADANPRLRRAVDDARAANMPAENVKRAIMRGTGEIPGISYEELTYEGYGPSGVAILVEVTTDNRNRTLGEIRTIFTKGGGNLGEAGCVGWMFKAIGLVSVPKAAVKDEDAFLGQALDLGAQDIATDLPEAYQIYCEPKDLEKVKQGLEALKIPAASAEAVMKPENTVSLDEAAAPKVLKLMEALEEHDDVKNVYANFDIPDSILAKLSS